MNIVRHALVSIVVLYLLLFYYFFSRSFAELQRSHNANGFDLHEQHRLQVYMLIPLLIYVFILALAWLFPNRITRRVFTVIFIVLGTGISCLLFPLAWESGSYMGVANAAIPTAIVGSILIYNNFYLKKQ